MRRRNRSVDVQVASALEGVDVTAQCLPSLVDAWIPHRAVQALGADLGREVRIDDHDVSVGAHLEGSLLRKQAERSRRVLGQGGDADAGA